MLYLEGINEEYLCNAKEPTAISVGEVQGSVGDEYSDV